MNPRNNCPENAQGVVEYALIVLGIALVIILALNLLGVELNDVYCQVSGFLGGKGCDGQLDSSASCSYAFDDEEDLENWVTQGQGASLGIEGGQLCTSNSSFHTFDGCGESVDSDDFIVHLEGVVIESVNASNGGIDFMFRRNQQGDGYRFSYSTSSNVIIFWKEFGSKRVLIGRAIVPSDWRGESINFILKVKGDTFSAYRDDELILTASDGAYSEGGFAWRNKPGSKSCIDGIWFE